MIPMSVGVNFSKVTMMVYLFSMMVYFNNFSIGAWVYISLHGNYGICWYIRDKVFGDESFNRKTTITSFIGAYVFVLIPYYMIGFWMMSGTHNRDPSPERIFIAIQLYVLGVVFMLLTDGQKNLVLAERKGLITHCMNGWSRNMNYVGEMMLYSSFAVMC